MKLRNTKGVRVLAGRSPMWKKASCFLQCFFRASCPVGGSGCDRVFAVHSFHGSSRRPRSPPPGRRPWLPSLPALPEKLRRPASCAPTLASASCGSVGWRPAILRFVPRGVRASHGASPLYSSVSTAPSNHAPAIQKCPARIQPCRCYVPFGNWGGPPSPLCSANASAGRCCGRERRRTDVLRMAGRK